MPPAAPSHGGVRHDGRVALVLGLQVLSIQVQQIGAVRELGQRGLGLDEQVRRSRQLVQMTIKSAHKCLDVEAPSVAAALDSVARSLVAPAGAVSRAQSVDENISLAGALWRMREGRCTGRPDNEALALVQDRIGQ